MALLRATCLGPTVTMPLARSCEVCSQAFEPKRKHARTCSTACRMKAHRARLNKPLANSRAEIIARALQRSSFMLGVFGNTRGLVVPRSAALAELNNFLRLPEAITHEELKAVLRKNGWRDHGSGK